jgi:hypothetical protein
MFTERENSMKRFGWLKIMVALTILLGQNSTVFGSAEYDTWGSYYEQAGGLLDYDVSVSNPSYVRRDPPHAGPWTAVVIPNGNSYSQTYGYADASNLAMGVNAWAKSTQNNSHFTDARMITSASNRFTVNRGTSGLVDGDITTLILNVRLDGTLHAGASQWPEMGWAYADIRADLEIHDYNIQVDTGEGFISPAQASFGASAEIEAYDVNFNYWNYTFSSDWEESWRAESNISPDIYHSDSWDTRAYDFNGYSHSLNTGNMTIAFEAIVGHTLDLDAALYAYVSANNGGEAWSDFNNTFAFDVEAAEAGVKLDWEIARTAIPVPGALPLLASGLLGLLGFRRRQAGK